MRRRRRNSCRGSIPSKRKKRIVRKRKISALIVKNSVSFQAITVKSLLNTHAMNAPVKHPSIITKLIQT
jgi:hypothetical protein